MAIVMLKLRPKRSVLWRAVAVGAAFCVALSACGGDDDKSSPTTVAVTVTPSIVADPTITQATPAPPESAPAEPTYVTEGAKVIVANASRVNGAAGRMSDRLAEVKYDMGEATNASETYQNIETTEIHYTGGEEVKKVADSLAVALGGGAIKVVELTNPAPTESGNVPAGISIIVLMGNDTADKTLEVLQGRAPESDTSTEGSTSDDTTNSSSEETTAGSSPDDTTADSSSDTAAP